ncbi:Putative Glycoside Hydrolase Family 18 [Podospora comata]|uniref:chitinase n=1 Tax=Podospora comata TaxID=48703 RepID=A0ABY6RYR9_PODCO|nr:Putative Glycoside Hydrolase Family 18 [Podospora comata]
MRSLNAQQHIWLALFLFLAIVSIQFWSYAPKDRSSHSELTARQRLPVTGNDTTASRSTASSNNLEAFGQPPAGFARVLIDDPYTCGPGRPCSNGACCGPSGNCGYAPAYCGTGCLSNCDAKAPCGQYAKIPGTTCPLNACCSEHGFCGTTEVQGLMPLLSRLLILVIELLETDDVPVIGYYESWSYRSKCNQKSPSDLPLTELTHLFYAFAFIEPRSYALTTMDDETSEDLWQLTVDAKKFNPSLKVYVAVGGWTFSDNDTVTQPLFGEIASTESNRQKFADGVVKFLNKYGFDGLDIDWEYPGAPDRGGKPEDTPNFVLLLKTLRSTFDASPRRLGITFTIPSSFWYLRWFDLPGLLQYADWANMMSYDLHGTWDRNNPIGAIAQAHTNLTEINLAAQLLWRVGVRPDQVVLGYGFYGRSFQLENPRCSTPGCPFSGGAKQGPCSKEAGILMYYEIQAILKQVPNIKPVFDRKAAVKYFTFDRDQWISYDDAETFKLKREWANRIGFGGSMIWAVDTDDDKFSAMSGLVGYQVSHVDTSLNGVVALAQTSKNVAHSLQGENGQGCRVIKEYDCKPARDLRCWKGESLVGWDRDGCGKEDEGKPICCPEDTAPQKCVWRGSGNDGGIWGDCNGQCHAGEARVLNSRWGGGPEKDRESDPYVCARGNKVFCCEAGDWKTVIDGCYWTTCGEPSEYIHYLALLRHLQQEYCCPNDTPLHSCTWRGSAPECVDSNCKMQEDGKDLAEVQVDSHAGGSSWNLCSWGRKKSMCCQVSKRLPPPLVCDKTTCDLDPAACIDNDGEFDLITQRRGIVVLEKRTAPRKFSWWTTNGAEITQWSLAYVTGRALWRLAQQGFLDRYYDVHSQNCDNARVESRPIEEGGDLTLPPNLQVEHPLPLVAVARFAAVANHGQHWNPRRAGYMGRNGRPIGQLTPEGPQTRTPGIRAEFWQNVWNNANGLPAGLPPVTPNSSDIRRPVERLYEAIGSNRNPAPFTFLHAAVNAQKGRIEGYVRPMSEEILNEYLDNAQAGDETAVNRFLNPLRETRGVFQYVRDDQVVTQLDGAVSAIYQQLGLIERNVLEAQGLTAHWNEFYPHYFSQVSEFARTWSQDHIRAIREYYDEHPDTVYQDEVLKELKEIEDSIPDWKYKFED